MRRNCECGSGLPVYASFADKSCKACQKRHGPPVRGPRPLMEQSPDGVNVAQGRHRQRMMQGWN